MSDSLLDTIEPKSDQLNADDLIGGPITVKIAGVKRAESGDQPIKVLIDGMRPFLPCKSMRRVMISVWGEQGSDWVGHSMTLYRDPDVRYGGVAVGGIRISHMTGIESRREMMLTASKAKRAKYTVQPLKLPKEEQQDMLGGPSFDDVMRSLTDCETADDIEGVKAVARDIFKGLTDSQKAMLTESIKAAEGGLADANTDKA